MLQVRKRRFVMKKTMFSYIVNSDFAEEELIIRPSTRCRTVIQQKISLYSSILQKDYQVFHKIMENPKGVSESNFGLSSYKQPQPNGGFKEVPCYQLTKKGVSHS